LNVAKRTPAVTLILIAANIAASFLLVGMPDISQTFGFVPAKPTFTAVFTGLFLHANVIHLLGNMVFLAAAGPATEIAVGPLRFFAVYIVGGVSGVLLHWALLPNTSIPLIGASGAVAACAVLGAVRFYRTRVPLAPNVAVPVLAVVAFWIVLQAVGAFVQFGIDEGGAAFWAHLGGAGAGLLLALVLKTNKAADLAASHETIAVMNARGPAAALAAAEQHLNSHPNDLKALLNQADALVQLGERGRASLAYATALEVCPEASQAQILQTVARQGCLSGIPSHRRTVLSAKVLAADPELSRLLLESVVSGPKDDSQRPDAILALAEMRRETDPGGARKLVDELFQNYPLHPAVEIAKAKGWTL